MLLNMYYSVMLKSYLFTPFFFCDVIAYNVNCSCDTTQGYESYNRKFSAPINLESHNLISKINSVLVCQINYTVRFSDQLMALVVRLFI